MILLNRKYISRLFISLWVITHVFQSYHEYAHHTHSHGNDHHFLCSHYHHNKTNLIYTTTERVAGNEECVICDYEWFNLFESPTDYWIHRLPEIIPIKLGRLIDALNKKWIISPFPQRGPPLRV